MHDVIHAFVLRQEIERNMNKQFDRSDPDEMYRLEIWDGPPRESLMKKALVRFGALFARTRTTVDANVEERPGRCAPVQCSPEGQH